jgi:hypothetical protein
LRRRASIPRRATVSSHASDSQATVPRPIGQRGGERLRQGVLGRRHIPRACGEKGDQLAVTAPGNSIGSDPCLSIVFVQSHVFT